MSVGGVGSGNSVNLTPSSGGSDDSTYTVQSGDTMSAIASDNNVSLDSLIDANPQVKDPDVIHPGQELKIPKGQQAQAQGAQATGQTTGVDTQADRFENGGSHQNQVKADAAGGNATAAVRGDPNLGSEVSALRAGGGYRSTSSSSNTGATNASKAQDQEEESIVPSNLHMKSHNGETGKLNANGQRVIQQRGSSRSHTRYNNYTVNKKSTHSSDGHYDSNTSGARVRNKTTGRERETTTGEFAPREKQGVEVQKNATANLFDAPIAGDNKWRGGDRQTSEEYAFKGDKTGAGGEAHYMSARGQAGASGTVDLKKGNVDVGANATGAVDIAGASGRAQVGSTKSLPGAGFVEGEAHVGARGDVGAGVRLNPKNGEVGARVGAEGFAGAEVRGTVGYENRYGGASVTGRGQAGIGGSAQAEASFSKGKVRLKADLGACVGLGGRVQVDVNVNVGAMVKDGTEALKKGWNSLFGG